MNLVKDKKKQQREKDREIEEKRKDKRVVVGGLW